MLSCWNPADAERRFKKKKLTKADSCTKWQLYRRDQPNGTFTGEISQMVRLQERYVPHQSRVGSIVLNVVKRVAHQSVVIKDARRATHSWKQSQSCTYSREQPHVQVVQCSLENYLRSCQNILENNHRCKLCRTCLRTKSCHVFMRAVKIVSHMSPGQ